MKFGETRTEGHHATHVRVLLSAQSKVSSELLGPRH